MMSENHDSSRFSFLAAVRHMGSFVHLSVASDVGRFPAFVVDHKAV